MGDTPHVPTVNMLFSADRTALMQMQDLTLDVNRIREVQPSHPLVLV